MRMSRAVFEVVMLEEYGKVAQNVKTLAYGYLAPLALLPWGFTDEIEELRRHADAATLVRVRDSIQHQLGAETPADQEHQMGVYRAVNILSAIHAAMDGDGMGACTTSADLRQEIAGMLTSMRRMLLQITEPRQAACVHVWAVQVEGGILAGNPDEPTRKKRMCIKCDAEQ